MNEADIRSNIQQILDIEFKSEPEKRKIVKRDKEFALACFHCGDSLKNPRKKRGTLYLNTLKYRCYNCGYKCTYLTMLKNYNINIDLDQKLEIMDYVKEANDKIHFSDDDFATKQLEKLIDIGDLVKSLNDNPKSPIKNFRPVTKGSKVYNYLISRKIFNFDTIYEGTYHYTDTWSEDVLINLNIGKGKVLGIQSRNLLPDKNKRRYRIFSFSELWELVNPDVELDDIEKIGYNRISYLYNILNIDWNQPITIFEGSLDTIFFPNSIGCVGTNTDLTFILNQEVDIKFFYDYDKTGIKKAKEKIKDGYSVFLWERMFDFWSQKTKNSTYAGRKLREKIKDLNDIAKILNNPYNKLELRNFFSKDEMDLIYIKNV